MKKRIVLICALAILMLAAGAVWFASWPAFSSARFPDQRIMTFERVQAPVRAATPHTLSVVSYNIGYASGDKNNQPVTLTREEIVANLDRMVAGLKELDADLIFLQEVDFDAARTHGIDQMRYLAEGIGMPFAAYAVTWNKRYVPWPYWPPRVHFGRMLSGQVVLSRFPLVRQTVTCFDRPGSNPFWYNLFYLDRCAQRISIDLVGNAVDIWNVHLEAFDENARHEQLAQLRSLIRDDMATLLVAGDFNEENGPSLHFSVGTEPLHRAGGDIDHIFYSTNLDLISDGVSKLTGSDHLPVWAQFRFRNP